MTPQLILLFLAPLLLGWLFLRLCLQSSALPLKKTFALLFAPAAGFALISLSVFVITLLIPQHARFGTVLTPWILCLIFLAWFIFKKAPSSSTPCARSSFLSGLLIQSPVKTQQILRVILNWVVTGLLLLAFINFTDRLMNYMMWNAFGGWDARYFWHLKARFYVRDPEQWQVLFSHYFQWGNNDYPLMVPGIIAWGWHLLGREALLWSALVSYIFTYSLGAIVVWHLAIWRSWLTAAIAGIFFLTMHVYLFWGGTMYCDIPFAFFSNSALLLLVSALRLKDRPVLALSAFFAGCSAFTKNEGILFNGWYGLLALIALIHLRRSFNKELIKDFLSLGLGLLIPLVICFYFKTAITDGHNNIITIKSPSDLITAVQNWPRIRVILEGYRLYLTDAKTWNGLWLLFFGACIYAPLSRKHARLSYSGILLAAIVLINLSYMFVFTISPQNIYRHIETALMRLLLQTGALAIVFIFETFGLESIKVEGGRWKVEEKS